MRATTTLFLLPVLHPTGTPYPGGETNEKGLTQPNSFPVYTNALDISLPPSKYPIITFKTIKNDLGEIMFIILRKTIGSTTVCCFEMVVTRFSAGYAAAVWN